MQNVLSAYTEKHSESNLGVLSACLIPEYGHKHLYTLIKKDIDGLHKDKLHRLTPSSFTVSFYIRSIKLLVIRYVTVHLQVYSNDLVRPSISYNRN